MAHDHDPATVERVARAMFNFVPQCTTWDDEDSRIREWYEDQGVAALDALSELGWRPPLTDDEQQDLRRVLDRAIDSGSKSGQDMTATLWLARMRRIRDMLTGGRADG